MKLVYHKIKHWEYWPTWLVYIPVFFAYLYFSVRAKSLYFFLNSNPGFKNGGFINISKKEIYNLIPAQYYPKTILIQPSDAIEDNASINEFPFPFIAKPDKGLRGIMVKKISNQSELKKYHEEIKCPYLIQELISFEKEIGIFYVRNPKHSKGSITGIVKKEFLTVIGDGTSTIEHLIRLDRRCELQLDTLKKEPNINLNKVMPLGEKLVLVPFGSHNRGALFLDVSHKNTPKLTQTIDAICKQIKGFNYGRIDLKFTSWSDLELGKNMSIIEVNGALSEPAHIYDPKHNYFWGVSEIIKHYNMMLKISLENRRSDKPQIRSAKVVKEMKNHFREVSKLKYNA